jgi:hypothetical protein
MAKAKGITLDNPADHLMKCCVTAQFLIDDLRRVSDYVGVSTVEEMENLFWFRQHFNGGFTLKTIDKNLDSGRAGSNESESNLGYNIRSIVQDQGLGLGDKSRGWGVDLWSQRVANVLAMNESGGFTFKKNSQYPMRGEHVEQAYDLRNVVRDQAMQSNMFGCLQETAEFFATDHLFCVIMVSEDRKSGTQTKAADHSYRQPFRRYVKAGTSVLMDTGLPGPDSTVNVTHFTREQIRNIRMSNPRWQSLIKGIKNHPGFDQRYLEQCRKDFHADNESTYHSGERSSSYYPELTERNLKIIARNDPVELCKEFYTWKIK